MTVFKRIAAIVCLLGVIVACAYWYLAELGLGKDGTPVTLGSVADTPRPMSNGMHQKQILFGDLHVHTDYSADAALFNLPPVSGFGGTTPGDACNYARYCSAVDFWSINDHAEGLTPRVWQETVSAIEQCNAVTNVDNPDLVSFLGWEWTQRSESPTSHYGHKNIVLREYQSDRVPSRPIAARNRGLLDNIPAVLRGVLAFGETDPAYANYNAYMTEVKSISKCDEGIDVRELPTDCREVASTPTALYKKLDQWGFDHLVIPHGLAWGTTAPKGADLKNQLAEHDPERQRLLEVYSGHGNSEVHIETEDFRRLGDGSVICPEPTDTYTPCCWQAGELARRQCDTENPQQCPSLVERAKRRVAEQYAAGEAASLDDIGGSHVNDWGQCGELKGFMPAYKYRPKQSAQYAYAIGGFGNETGTKQASSSQSEEKPKRYRFGLIGSSDNHKARAGNGYKEQNRVMITDTKDVGAGRNLITMAFSKGRAAAGSFYYSGGLVAVHSESRHRDDVWNALHRREVYGTSGERILLWFDLLNSPSGKAAMGSEVVMSETPRFEVRALGAFEQKPGCPEYATSGLGEASIKQLCGGECYNPGDTRNRIARIEVVRIQPQQSATESIGDRIEDPWKQFDCPQSASAEEGCIVEFEDGDFAKSDRETLYYVRAIQEPTLAINGDPFGCERDEQGRCVKVNFCVGGNSGRDNDCLHPAEERAWSSPIFVDPKTSAVYQ